MPQVGESVAVVAFGDEKWKCPFSHDDEQKDYRNIFIGRGTTLGKYMAKGKPTSNNPNYGKNERMVAEPDPREQKGHALNQKDHPRPVRIWHDGELTEWPVTSAAHHLIPAQESLARSDLLKWMINKDKPGKIKKGKSTETKNGTVENDIGYNVNGAQNGVWLPGPYAMQGIWASFLSFTDKEDEHPPRSGVQPKDRTALLDNSDNQFDYAVAAMRIAFAQFHDRHVKYSKFVLLALNRLAAKLATTVTEIGGFCKECEEKVNDGKIPPPYSLIPRLNGVSSRLRGRLEGGPGGWRLNIFTSNRAFLFMKKPNCDPSRKP